MEALPPEMQQRIAQIIAGAKQSAPEVQAPVAPPTPPAPPVPAVRQPNLMDHVIMLRQEVDQMRQQLDAVGQVTDAVGQAVGQHVCHVSKPNRAYKCERSFPSAGPAADE